MLNSDMPALLAAIYSGGGLCKSGHNPKLTGRLVRHLVCPGTDVSARALLGILHILASPQPSLTSLGCEPLIEEPWYRLRELSQLVALRWR